MTLCFLVVSLLALSSVMWWASSSGKVTQQNELFTTAEAAAEGYTEEVVATLDRDWTYGQSLQAASVYSSLPPPGETNWPIQFQFSDGSGNNNQVGYTVGANIYNSNLGADFPNLSGDERPCTITANATTVGQLYTVSATVQQVVYATIIPLFQFAIFYNLNLEIDPGAAMSINGPVFSNQGIWAGTPNVTFNSEVAAAGLVYDAATDSSGNDPWASGKNDSGTPSGNFAIAPVSKQDSLTLPVGTNNDPTAVEAIINLPPSSIGAPNAGAYTTNGQIYLFNESDIIISNSAIGLVSGKGTNITIWYQDDQQASPLTQISNDLYALKTGGFTNVIAKTNGPDSPTNVLYANFSFATNVQFYDYRETATNEAVQIDVGKFNTWLTNASATGGQQYNKLSYADKGRGIYSIYVYNKVPLDAAHLPSVRLTDGAQLPSTTDPAGSGRTTSGLTVTTPQPLYVEGNYNVQTATSSAGASANTTNTTYTYPAAIMGDAVTILSANWKDITGNPATSYLPATGLGSRNPSATTVNAACLEGIVQSTNSNYSGGLENFLRLEENWSVSISLTYNGSIVVMFPSIYATGFWQNTGNYYNPPKRVWGFDYNFTNPNLLPPLTPKFYKMIRGTWTSS
jgi:hypothetical protein